ncbi:claudin-10 isoform X5 [Puntigrus tetrazona]|uniref:claudin-10 isoform X5 n=1 Tax=Puntigrus tetrazona TaxID=1606681 RepID=UPI001C89AE33|nr:claudin-10 isoform X5 [Puntigrus tetrazona]
MHYRTVIMYTEMGCFVACVCGWILVCSTMPIEYWTYSEVESIVLTSGHYFSNLWKDCLSDSTGISDCKDFPTLLALQSLCGMVAYSWYAHKVISEFMDPNYKAKKFELGSALFVGWGGSALLVVGGFVYSITAGKEGFQSSSKTQEMSYHTPSSNHSEANQKTYSPPLSPIPDRANQTYSKAHKGSHAVDAYV